jgi:hypothetical protein
MQPKRTQSYDRAFVAIHSAFSHVHRGLPQTALMESITQAQKLLREDIIDNVLKYDMTALFGVCRIPDLE